MTCVPSVMKKLRECSLNSGLLLPSVGIFMLDRTKSKMPVHTTRTLQVGRTCIRARRGRVSRVRLRRLKQSTVIRVYKVSKAEPVTKQ